MAMNQILDFTKDYDYSDEKIKEFRKILKGSLTLVKSMATNEVVMDSVAIDFRETLGKATEQMIFFISGMDSIRTHRIIWSIPTLKQNICQRTIYEFSERRSRQY